MGELRKVEVFKDDVWKEIQFKDLRVGDRYRLFEPDGSPVVIIGDGRKLEGAAECIVMKDPYRISKDGVWTVECEWQPPKGWK